MIEAKITNQSRQEAQEKFQQGESLFKQCKWDEAISAYRHAIKLNPNNSWYHVCLAKVLSKQKRWDEVIVAYRRAMELNPDKF